MTWKWGVTEIFSVGNISGEDEIVVNKTERRWVKELNENYFDEIRADFGSGDHGCKLHNRLR